MDLQALMLAMEATASAAEKPVAVEVPGWGTVYVRGLTAADMDTQIGKEGQSKKHQWAAGVCRIMCDETGARNWNPDDEAHVALMARQPWSLLHKLTAAVEGDGPKG